LSLPTDHPSLCFCSRGLVTASQHSLEKWMVCQSTDEINASTFYVQRTKYRTVGFKLSATLRLNLTTNDICAWQRYTEHTAISVITSAHTIVKGLWKPWIHNNQFITDNNLSDVYVSKLLSVDKVVFD